MRIALATCRDIPEPDPDEALTLAAFAQAGVDARLVAWDDPDARFDDFDRTVLRSTWNYFHRLADFFAWIDRTPRVVNPPAVVRWNAEKTYLRDLARRGIAIVPTEFVRRGERRRLSDLPWDEIVVKPVVSGASLSTERFRKTDAKGQAFLDELARDRDVMIQEWMPAVEGYGERSLVLIDGEITHAVRKSPRFANGVESVSSGEVPIADDERAFAMRVIEAADVGRLLYGRVDMIRDEHDVLRVMELELVEPSLYFTQSPRALERFVRATLETAKR